jgi:CRP/FNR family transcriptional regulator, cyclic AMP receptor protein
LPESRRKFDVLHVKEVELTGFDDLQPARAGTMVAMVTSEFFAALEFFQVFSPESLERFSAAAHVHSFQRGDVVFNEGDEAEHLYVVKRGRVAIANRSMDRESLLALMGAGDLFGEMALFDGEGRSALARALEPAEVVSVPFTVMKAELVDDADALWKVIKLLTKRVRSADEALADSVFLDVTGRTAKRLLEMAGTSDEFQLPVTQEELAGMIGASRERVNKAIAQFVRLGWMEQHERTYRIVDRKRMTLRAS